jgi:FkbM family methyltransferase
MFTFAAASLSGSAGVVVAIEPDADNLRLLYRSRQSMQIDRNATVHILGAAVSNPGARIATFNIAVRSRSTNYLDGFGGTQTGGVRETRKVPLFTLDELLEHFPAPDVLKIDVEGAELSVIEGATRTLGQVRPNILIEVDDPNVEEAGRILRGYGYRLMNADLPPDARTEMAKASWNCLGYPN